MAHRKTQEVIGRGLKRFVNLFGFGGSMTCRETQEIIGRGLKRFVNILNQGGRERSHWSLLCSFSDQFNFSLDILLSS